MGIMKKITKNCLCSKTERETRIYTEVDKLTLNKAKK